MNYTIAERAQIAYFAVLVLAFIWCVYMLIQSLTYDFESGWRTDAAEYKAVELCVEAVGESWDRLTLEQQLSKEHQKSLKRSMKRCT